MVAMVKHKFQFSIKTHAASQFAYLYNALKVHSLFFVKKKYILLNV